MIRTLSLAMIVSLSAYNLSCGSDSQITSTHSTTKNSANISNINTMASAEQAFAMKLLKEIRNSNLAASENNLVFSPLSLMLALNMSLEGAKGETSSEIVRALSLESLASEERQAQLKRLSGNMTSTMEQDGYEFSIGNKLWLDSSLSIKEDFQKIMSEVYGAESERLAFSTEPDVSRVTINSWISDHTNGRINELIPQGAIHSLTKLVLANASYLRAEWLMPFSAEKTHTGEFITHENQTEKVAFMEQLKFFEHYRDDEQKLDYLRLPYKTKSAEGLRMVIVKADAGLSLSQLREKLSYSKISDLFDRKPILLRLPKWKIRTKLPAKALLEKLGIISAFRADQADFSGISAEAKELSLHISDVFHEAYVETDEKGSEAAAATAVVITATSWIDPSSAQLLEFNRPFLFWIETTQDSHPVIFGEVLHPQKS